MAFIKETTAEDWRVSINRKTKAEKAKANTVEARRKEKKEEHQPC